MKYLSYSIIEKSLFMIHNGDKKQEFITSRATSGLLNLYFPVNKNFIITPEAIQDISRKRPDYTIEKLDFNNDLKIHAYVEVKSVINSNFSKILDQLSDSIVYAADLFEDQSVFAIAMKGTKIAIYIYCNYASLLDEIGILNYNGFIPLNYDIPYEKWQALAHASHEKINYMEALSNYYKETGWIRDMDKEKLLSIGVESHSKINYPHIWDLLNKDHEDYVHNMFMRMASSEPYIGKK